MKKIIALLFVLLITFSCTDSMRADFGSYGKEHFIALYSGGEAVQTWISTGKVETMEGSDGWQFMDKKTKKLIRVSGNIIIKVKE